MGGKQSQKIVNKNGIKYNPSRHDLTIVRGRVPGRRKIFIRPAMTKTQRFVFFVKKHKFMIGGMIFGFLVLIFVFIYLYVINPPEIGTWQYSEFQPCSQECGKDGVRTRDVWCQANHKITSNSNCKSSNKPTSEDKCNRKTCPKYYWRNTAKKNCSAKCGSGHETRSWNCWDRDTNSEANVENCTQQKPDTNVRCNSQPCDGDHNMPVYHYQLTEFGDCVSKRTFFHCGADGEGIRQRTAHCMKGNIQVRNQDCENNGVHLKDALTEACELPTCGDFEWEEDNKTDCSLPCGTGEQTVLYRCINLETKEIASSYQHCETRIDLGKRVHGTCTLKGNNMSCQVSCNPKPCSSNYVWKVSAFTPPTCRDPSTTEITRSVTCYDIINMKNTDEANCDKLVQSGELEMKPDTKVTCTHKILQGDEKYHLYVDFADTYKGYLSPSYRLNIDISHRDPRPWRIKAKDKIYFALLKASEKTINNNISYGERILIDTMNIYTGKDQRNKYLIGSYTGYDTSKDNGHEYILENVNTPGDTSQVFIGDLFYLKFVLDDVTYYVQSPKFGGKHDETRLTGKDTKNIRHKFKFVLL